MLMLTTITTKTAHPRSLDPKTNRSFAERLLHTKESLKTSSNNVSGAPHWSGVPFHAGDVMWSQSIGHEENRMASKQTGR